MRARLLIVLIMCAPVVAAKPEDVVGVWKLVSWQVIVDNEPPQDVFGLHPKGYLILTREGRAIVLTTAENRKSGTTDPERAALHRSMLAYTGKYRIEGQDLITRVDASWNEEWNGTEQKTPLSNRGKQPVHRVRPGAEHPIPRQNRLPEDRLGERKMT